MFVQTQKKGIILSKENSDTHYQSAEILSSKGNYGPAISLLVLSSEEIVKSFALCLEVFLGNKSEVKKIIGSTKKQPDSYLFDHVEKHKLISVILYDLKKISLPLRLFLPLAQYIFSKDFVDIFKYLTISGEQSTQLESTLINIEKFNDLKKQGFYVDKKDDEWMTPQNITEAEYQACKKDVEVIRGILSPKIDYLVGLDDNDWQLIVDVIEK